VRRRDFIAGAVTASAIGPARAQQKEKVYRIAIVSPASPITDISETGSVFYRAFLGELRRLGYVEGENLVVDRFSGSGRPEKYRELVDDVVRSRPGVVLTSSTLLTLEFKAQTRTIPVVTVVTDPTSIGIENVSRPGGNITGVYADAGVESKRFGILKEAIPNLSRVGLLVAPTPQGYDAAEILKKVADKTGIALVLAPVESPDDDADYRSVFAAIVADGVEAVYVVDQSEYFAKRRLLVELAKKHRLPAIYGFRDAVEIGGLMAYAVDYGDQFLHAADAVAEILKGTKAGDIPFNQATKFNLIINLKTAKALSLEISPNLLAQADEVIE
jgi:putative ABC transport system substrate-binding protein